MNSKKIDGSSFRYYFVLSWQLFWWFVQYIPLRYIFRIKIKEDFSATDIKKPVLIVSNHKTTLDPWFITMSLPLNKYYSLIPIRPIVTRHFHSNLLKIIYRFWIIPFAYYPNGALALPPRKKNHLYTTEDKLKKPLKALKEENVSVLLFPEGKMVKEKEDAVEKFKPGVAHLIKSKPNNVLFVSLRKKRGRYEVNWSQAYKPEVFYTPGTEDSFEDIQNITEKAYNIVNRLYKL